MSDEAAAETTTNGTSTRAPRGAGEMVPSFRLAEERSKRDEAMADAQKATEAMAAMRAQLEAVTGELTGLQSTHTQELHLVELGFKAPSIRRFLRREYASAASEAGEAAPKFGDWLDANREDPLYAPHFQSLAGDDKPETKAAPKEQDPTQALLDAVRATMNGNPERGTGSGAVHHSREYGPEEIRKIRATNGGTLGDQKDAILATLRAQGLIK